MRKDAVWKRACVLAVATATWAAAAAGSYVSAEPREGPDYRAPYGTTMPLDEELLVPVSVWGEVTRPGYYNVPDGSDVARLLSYAGGPTEFANLSRVKLTRPDGGASAVDIKQYIDTGDVVAVPVLKPGDTVYVYRNEKYAWREFVKVMSELAVVAGTVLLYIEVAKGD